jgi:predicted RNase H-like HicB family nuclease
MAKYEINLKWSDADNAYIAVVPELPGCMADGQTYSEALANAEVVINEWIETASSLGRSIPQPKRITQTREVLPTYAFA